jgi:hypothetical protein
MKETKVTLEELQKQHEDFRYANQAAIKYWQKARDSQSVFSRWINASIAEDCDKEAKRRYQKYLKSHEWFSANANLAKQYRI